MSRRKTKKEIRKENLLNADPPGPSQPSAEAALLHQAKNPA